MINVKREFQDRHYEIDKYFQFLETLENDFRNLINLNSQNETQYQIDDDLFKILKANGFLLLYNLIESTILNSIIAIFDELSISNKSFKDVSEKIRRYWLKDKYK